MIRFLNRPNLPEGKVKSVICGEMPDRLKDFFKSRGIQTVFCGKNKFVDPSVFFHADMAALHLGGETIIADKNRSELINKLKNAGLNVKPSKSEIKGDYPFDISLNFALIGDYIIGKQACLDETVQGLTQGYKKIDVKQGYAKCSVLPVNEKAFITDDASIYNKCPAFGFDVLLVEKGDIFLEGHQYGFIGGSGGKISQNEVLFFGDLSCHRNKEQIIGFLEKHYCKALSIDNLPLCDIGGIIPFTEEF